SNRLLIVECLSGRAASLAPRIVPWGKRLFPPRCISLFTVFSFPLAFSLWILVWHGCFPFCEKLRDPLQGLQILLCSCIHQLLPQFSCTYLHGHARAAPFRWCAGQFHGVATRVISCS